MHYKKKVETSKFIVFFMMIMTLLVVGFSLFQMYKCETIEPLVYIIPATFAELATGTGFYYWKTKSENKLKITLGAIDQLSSKTELSDNDVRVLEALLQSLN